MPSKRLLSTCCRFGALLIALLIFIAIPAIANAAPWSAARFPTEADAPGSTHLPWVKQAIPTLDFAAGDGYTCAQTYTREVFCWGAKGRLGSTEASLSPVRVPNLWSNVKAIDAGGWRSCAVVEDGKVKCWGGHYSGETFDGVIYPDIIEGLTDIVDVAVGTSHSCALLQSGGMRCWGSNSVGQLGDGNLAAESPVVNVSGLDSGVAAIALGASHSCALLNTGELRCWGSNDAGELGDGNVAASQPLPVTVVGLPQGVKAIAAGGSTTCALLEAGEVYCWGEYYIADNVSIRQLIPTVIEGLANRAVAIDVGENHSCALLTDSSVQCWGDNRYGQLGNGTTTSTTTPVKVTNLGVVTGISLSIRHSCAAFANGTLKCWGDNHSGELGNQLSEIRRTPVNVAGLSQQVLAIDADGWQSCLLLAGGNVRCWGENEQGQVGDGSTEDRYSPAATVALEGIATAISVGTAHSCALLENGDVQCWGANGSGQLGNGTTSYRSSPVTVAGLDDDATAIATGVKHSCALLQSQRIQCWGDNRYGQLGDGNRTATPSSPVTVEGLSAMPEQVAVGGTYSCAVLTGNIVQCWGSNAFGELGNGTTMESQMTPVAVQGISGTVESLVLGFSHSCVLLEDGTVQCWGANGQGQSGGNRTENKLVATTVEGLAGAVKSLAAGELHTCALLEDGSVQCWGDNNWGQVGVDANGGVPATVTGLAASGRAIATGYTHSCAFLTNGEVQCWGAANYVGDGSVWFQQVKPVDALWTPDQ